MVTRVPADELQAWVPDGVRSSTSALPEWVSAVPTDLDLGGVTTLRYSANNGDFDFLLLTPAPTERPMFTKTTLNANGTLTLEWTGGGVLQAAPTINGPWAPIAGATSPFTFTPDPAVGQLYGRIVR